jgi:hypothetical protein
MGFVSNMGQQMGGFQPAQGTQASNPFGIGGGNFNMLPVDMQGNYLTGNEGLSRGVGMPTSDPREMDGTFNLLGGGNFPGAVIDQPMLPPPGNYTGGMPGMGGKGGMPSDAPPGSMLGFPIDNPPMPVSEPTSMGGLPPAPNAQMPLGRVSGGTLGRPSASAPMVPRGPGANNPGSPGNPPPQPPERGMLTPPQGPQNRLQPAPAAPAAPIVSQRARVPRQAPVSMKGGMARGAGRGGLLR